MSGPAGSDLLARVASFALSGHAILTDRHLDAGEWDRLLARAVRQRVEGMLATAVEQGALPVTEDQLEATRMAVRSRARADLLLERETIETAALLESVHIPHRILKGPALAHSAYPDPMLRGFGDVDILVHPDCWYESLDVLQNLGATRLFPELRPGFDARFGKDATLVSHSGLEIDLHRTLALGPYGLWVDCDELFDRPAAVVSLGGTRIPVLDREAAFLHACYNAVLADDPPRLAALRDVAQMALSGSMDPEEVFLLARRWRGIGVVRRALTLTAEYLELTLACTPVGDVFAGASGPWDRFLLASYRGKGRGYTSQLAGVVAVSGLRTKLAYLSALAHPQPSYLEARGFTQMGFLEHALKKVERRR